MKMEQTLYEIVIRFSWASNSKLTLRIFFSYIFHHSYISGQVEDSHESKPKNDGSKIHRCFTKSLTKNIVISFLNWLIL